MKNEDNRTVAIVSAFWLWCIGFAIIITHWYYGAYPAEILRVYEQACYDARLENCSAWENYEARAKELKEERTCLIQQGCIGVHEVNHP